MINNKIKISLYYAGTFLGIIYIIYISLWWSNLTNENNIHLKYSHTSVLDIKIYQKIVNDLALKNKLDNNLNKITTALESHPYIKATRVSRQYPNQITIEIIERSPIAIVNKSPLVLLDKDGFVLPNITALKSYDFPIMTNFNSDSSMYPSGKIVRSVKAKQCISLLSNIQNIYNKLYNNLSELNISSNNEIELILTDHPTHIYLGNNNIISRINVLKQFEKKLSPQKMSDFSYLDMRYKNQIVAKLRIL